VLGYAGKNYRLDGNEFVEMRLCKPAEAVAEPLENKVYSDLREAETIMASERESNPDHPRHSGEPTPARKGGRPKKIKVAE
jgi:hypothetical protein